MIRARFDLQRSGSAPFALHVDLTLPDSGVIAIFGPSGSGKTTLLRLVAGFERPASGFLQIGDSTWQDARHFTPPHRRAIGFVFQEASLFPHLDVTGNLAYGARRSGAFDARAVQHTAALLGIDHLLARDARTLSGGERQRVAIGRALLSGPRILLMDEPLSALDEARKQELLPYLQRLHRTLSIPILYVSHSAQEVAQLADHLVVMEAGKVVASGPLAETLANVETPIRLGEDAGVIVEGTIGERDPAWHLARVDCGASGIWTRDTGLAVGAPVRLRILARDVSLSLHPPEHSSILNSIPGRVLAVAEDSHPALCLVKIDISGTPLLARLTRRSAHTLGITPGIDLWVQVKAVAIVG